MVISLGNWVDCVTLLLTGTAAILPRMAAASSMAFICAFFSQWMGWNCATISGVTVNLMMGCSPRATVHDFRVSVVGVAKLLVCAL